MMKPVRQSILVLAAALPLAAAGARAADLVVVEARGVAFSQGQVVDDTKPLVLKEGQQVTLIAASGSVIKLRGPYEQAPATEAAGSAVDVGSALAALTTKSDQRTNVAGVVRSKTEDVVLPNPWVVDVTHAGSACIREGDPIVFWRRNAVESPTLTIMPADRSWRAQAGWSAGNPMMVAPTGFPLRDRGTYLADLGGRPVAVTLNTIPHAVSNDRMQAAWMLEKGCVAQAEALLKTTR